MPKDGETEEETPDEDEETPSSEDKEEESELEEELEESEQIADIRDLEFSSFIQPSIESSAPVLERITGSQGTGSTFSGWEALSTPVSSEGTIEEDDPFKYSVGGGVEEGGAKYIASEQMAAAPTQLDFRDVGRRPEVRPEVSFTQSSEASIGEPVAVEKYDPARRIDIGSAGRDPFEREKRKYEFKPPKS